MKPLKHPNILAYIGVSESPDSLMLVLAFAKHGSLKDYLLLHIDQGGTKLKDRMKWCLDTAEGMAYLEKNDVLHRDLACRNLLLNENMLVQISDFGMSRFLADNEDIYTAQKRGKWPMKWYAPESINKLEFTRKSDVWSYGITAWEILQEGEQPYAEWTAPQAHEAITRGHRMQCPYDCPDVFYASVLEKCWQYQPDDRPSFVQLCEVIRAILAN